MMENSGGQFAFDFPGSGRQLSPKLLKRLEEPKGDLLYFAVLPPPDIAQRIAILAKNFAEHYHITGRPKRPDLMHISLLRFDLKRIPLPHLMLEARQMASGVSMKPFDVRFDRAMGFADRKKPAIVLTCRQGRQELLSLYRNLASQGSGTVSDAYEPHLTFIYNKRPFPQTVPVDPITWTVREFVLIYSHYGEGRHEYRGQWPLEG